MSDRNSQVTVCVCIQRWEQLNQQRSERSTQTEFLWVCVCVSVVVRVWAVCGGWMGVAGWYLHSMTLCHQYLMQCSLFEYIGIEFSVWVFKDWHLLDFEPDSVSISLERAVSKLQDLFQSMRVFTSSPFVCCFCFCNICNEGISFPFLTEIKYLKTHLLLWVGPFSK